ncbi:MAG: LPS export ABC transporter periplasmic protein LptC [Betaproteobacteria bacterium HGW-Betaproteobacteria-21]|nr:MAG: LPS export ABC transporter periplasmic protein LptC [Betaproteobacteria bacterium HGW-Betaproteobacteria-21]
MQATYRLYPIIAVALLAAASIWLERLTREPDSVAAPSANTAPDFIAEQTRIVGFGKDGRQRYALVAERMTHYPDTDITQVEHPRLEITSGERLLEIRANQGEVSAGGERVDFSGKVEAQREGDPGQVGMTFAAEQLAVWPEEHRAESTVPVRLTQGQTTALANGLRADNLFGTLDLIGQARVNIPRRQGNTP